MSEPTWASYYMLLADCLLKRGVFREFHAPDPLAATFSHLRESLYKERCTTFMASYRARHKKYEAKNAWWYYGPVYYEAKYW